MELITDFLLMIVVWLGVVGGAILSFTAPEELKPGKQHFKLAFQIIFLCSIAIFLYSLGLNIFIEIILMLIALVIVILSRPNLILYSFSAFLLVGNVFVASLLFVLGMVKSTLFLTPYVKKEEFTKPKIKLFFEVVKWHSPFLAVGLAGIFIQYLFF